MKEKRINKITKGGASKKVINGRTYYYYQWYENGVKRTKLISKNEYDDILENGSDNYLRFLHASCYIGVQLVKGDDLLQTIYHVKDYQKRDCFSAVNEYVNSEPNGKLLALYGLRRTGKTTLMFQSIIANLDKIKQTAYITLDDRASIESINLLLNNLLKENIKYVYIDEITMCKDFIDYSQFISDVYAMRMKIVICGTDSLGIYIASKEALLDRVNLIHTTYISFKEYQKILGINDIDKYIEYGGTLSSEGNNYHQGIYPMFYDERSGLNYIDNAICRNIQKSLENYRDGYNLTRLVSLKDKNQLTNVINRIIQDNNHRFLKEVINKSFKSQDYGSLKELLRKNEDEQIRTALDLFDEELIYRELMNKLDITDDLNIEEEDLDELYEYLRMLDVIDQIDITDVESGKTYKKVVFTQPGLRYSQAKALLETIIESSSLTSIPLKTLDVIKEKLLSDVKGRILEEIVLYETSRNSKDVVFKPIFRVGEFDMGIYNKESNSIHIFEVKHSQEAYDSQTKNFFDIEKIEAIKKRYGDISSMTVLYKGESMFIDNIEYRNVEEYLVD